MRMQRFVPYLGIVAALAVVLAVMAFYPGVSVTREAPAAATTTFAVVANPPIPALESEVSTHTPATTTPAATEKKIPMPPAKEPVALKATAPAALIPAPPPPIPTEAELDVAAAALRAALVNILCLAPAGSSLRSTSGSGIIIDPKGIILTNAHIADQFLLADRGVSCTIRSGSPATDRYGAALVYISPLWLSANANILSQTNPSGSGEYDFALLAINKSANVTPLPPSFPFIPLARDPLAVGAPVVIASYGAQFIGSNQIQSSLSPTIVFGSVKDVFTFRTNTIDVLELGGSAAAQEGSSGGGVANAKGELAGTITTSTIEGATDTRSLSAITASYIRAAYASETGNALDLLLAQPTAAAIAAFAPQLPALEALITASLP